MSEKITPSEKQEGVNFSLHQYIDLIRQNFFYTLLTHFSIIGNRAVASSPTLGVKQQNGRSSVRWK
jgi:hypothetical protein